MTLFTLFVVVWFCGPNQGCVRLTLHDALVTAADSSQCDEMAREAATSFKAVLAGAYGADWGCRRVVGP